MSGQAGLLSCPWCGGMVAPTGHACEFCRAHLLVRSCPRCLARVFHGHKHCPHCGVVTGDATRGAARDKPRACPRCSRELEPHVIDDVLVDDCAGCGGVYIDAAAVERLLGDRRQARADAVVGRYRTELRADAVGTKAYVKCPDCGTIMNRRQFARGARVIVDVCKGHGTWFDAGELPAVVEFVMNGGLERAAAAELADQRAALQRDRERAQAAGASVSSSSSTKAGDAADGGFALLDLLFSIWR